MEGEGEVNMQDLSATTCETPNGPTDDSPVECEEIPGEVSEPILNNEMVCDIPENEDSAFRAVRFNDVTMIVRRINEGFDVNSRHIESTGCKVYTIKDWSRMIRQLRLKEYTLLHVAVVHAEMKTIKLLLSKGAGVNSVDVNHMSPLALAAAVQRPDVVRLLLKLGADPNIQSVSGRTPLIQAIGNNNLDIVKLMVEAGADLDLADTKGTTPLFTCLQVSPATFDIRIVQALIEGGCQVDFQNAQGATPLMMAAGFGRRDVAEILLQAGADVNHMDNAGKTAIHLAMGWRTALYLMNRGAASDVADKKGQTPLDQAAKNGFIAMLKLLLGTDCERSTSILDVPRVVQACSQYPIFHSWLLEELHNPRELKRLCRQTIRCAMSPSNTKHMSALPVPQLLKDFLVAKHFDMAIRSQVTVAQPPNYAEPV